MHTLFPQAPELQPGMQLFALHAADGTPIMLTDSREAAVANAPGATSSKPSACTDVATTGARQCARIGIEVAIDFWIRCS